MENLTATLAALGVKQLPSTLEKTPIYNLVDIYRSHIASLVSDIINVDVNVVQASLGWTQSLDKGDLVLPVPALRLKGKPNDIAQDICDKVRVLCIRVLKGRLCAQPARICIY